VVSQSQAAWTSSIFAGLPRFLAIERHILALQAFIDESGDVSGKSSERKCVLSGFVASVPQWDAFNDAWHQSLNTPPKIYKGFHMRKWIKRKNKEEVNEKLKSLAAIITCNVAARIDSIVDLAAYREIVQGKVDKPVDSPYFFAFHQVIARFCDDCVERGISERVKITFDRNVIFGPRAKKWYQMVRDIAPKSHKKILPVEPLFDDDTEALPLQAADMLAYVRTNRLSRDSNEYLWVEKSLDTVREIRCPVLDHYVLDRRVSAQNDPVSKRLTRKWEKIFG
jgi:hypothetical protein